MPGFHHQIRAGVALSVLITLVVALVLVSPSASAKGATVIVLHGPLLDEPVVLADFGENLAFIPDVLPIPQPADLDERPFLELTGLVGARWLDVAADPTRWDEFPLDPDRRVDGVTHERIYLGTAGSPPLLVTNPHLSRGFQGFRSLGSQAVRVLAKHGLPAHVDDLTGSPATSFAGRFAPGPTLTTPRTAHTATLLPSGEVLIAGGAGTSGWLDTAEIYNPTANTFRPVDGMSVPRIDHTATLLLDGRVLIVGGTKSVDGEVRGYTTVEIYDPATRTFAPAGETLAPRRSHTATLLPDGTVLIAGGSDALTPTAEIYDPRSGTSRSTGEMSVRRQLHRAATLADGRVVLAGGLYPDFSLIDPGLAFEVFDPALDRFTLLTPSDPLARTNALLRRIETGRAEASVTLQDGSILFTGGYGGLLARGAAWRDRSNAYAPVGAMATPRRGHTATRLLDGRVLLVGGVGEEPESFSIVTLASAEIFTPSLRPIPPTLPSTGSGGLADEPGNGPQPLLWASLAALAAVAAGAGFRLRKRRR